MNIWSIVEFLRDPSSYVERPQRVDVRETHISWVFLTDTQAYKLKKPVKFDFLDFSTPQLRRGACEDELRLNRRLAPEVYLEVVPITVNNIGRLALKGDGVEIDCLVKMRRLPDDRSLQAMILAGCVCKDDVRRIAKRMTQFYDTLPPVSLQPADYRDEIEQHVRSNRQALLEAPDDFASDIVKRIHTAQLRFLLSFPEVFDERVCDGRVVDGHGDLRPEHIYLSPTPVIIDCIEFNAEYRQLDVLDELCFLAMECTHVDAAWIGQRIIDQYINTSGDRPSRELRAFYTAYRACVRAKVHLLRASQMPASARDRATAEALRYLKQTDEISHQLGSPSAIIVRGPAGVGKTTLAESLAELLGTEYLQTDAVRREVFGQTGQSIEYNEGQYSAENRNRVYQCMFDRAEEFLSRGLSVILDGTFLTNDLQRAGVNLACRLGAQPMLANCICPPEMAAQRITERIEARVSLSDAQVTTHQQQRQEEELPPTELPQCFVDTTYALPSMTRIVLDALRSQT